MDEHTASDLENMLRVKYSGDAWAFFSQVASTTDTAPRRCDGLAMSLWPSRGLHLHGFEIKVSRSDWLTEIQDPAKAAAFTKFCNFWWIVAPPGIVKLEELPAEWGLQQVTRSGNLRVKKAASLRTPEPIDSGFLAGLCRACFRESSERELEQAYARGRDEHISEVHGELAAARRYKITAERWGDRLKCLRESVREFEEASGIKINDYNGRSLGEDFKRLQTVDTSSERIAFIRSTAEEVLELTSED